MSGRSALVGTANGNATYQFDEVSESLTHTFKCPRSQCDGSYGLSVVISGTVKAVGAAQARTGCVDVYS